MQTSYKYRKKLRSIDLNLAKYIDKTICKGYNKYVSL